MATVFSTVGKFLEDIELRLLLFPPLEPVFDIGLLPSSIAFYFHPKSENEWKPNLPPPIEEVLQPVKVTVLCFYEIYN